MVGQALTHDAEVVQQRGESKAECIANTAGADGPEFSSEPMPAAYGALIAAGIGLLIIVACLAIFWWLVSRS